MPGNLMWGYYPTDNKWVPLKVDTHGSIVIACTVDELNDIGDVNASSPTDDDVLYWDNAASKWQSKANWVAAHKATHQNGGADEVSVAGLSGLLADDQHVLDAEAVSAMGAKGDANPLHHDKYTDANAVSAMGAKGDANPLHHDKAAEWGATEHTAIGDNAPHHVKYTNAEAKAAAVLAGAITDAETKAPTHDAVFDIINADKTIKDADGDTKIQTEESSDEDKIRMDVAGVEAFHLSAVGILTLAKQSAASAYQTSDQTIAHGTDTVIDFDTESYDIQGEFNLTNDRFTATEPGLYLTIGACQLRLLDTGKYGMVRIRVNGTPIFMHGFYSPIDNLNLQFATTAILLLSAGDYVDFAVRHDNGANLDTYSGIDRVWCAIAKIA